MSAVQLAVEDHPGIIGQWRTPVISRATRRGMRTARRQRRGRWRVPDDCADGHNRETRTLQWDGGTRATWRTARRGRQSGRPYADGGSWTTARTATRGHNKRTADRFLRADGAKRTTLRTPRCGRSRGPRHKGLVRTVDNKQ